MKTVSLKLAKQLKEAGYPQESFFWWTEEYKQEALDREDDWWLHWHANVKDGIASPTADEILDQLPMYQHIDGANYFITAWRELDEDWFIAYERWDKTREHVHTDKSLADAAAKMWLHLKKD